MPIILEEAVTTAGGMPLALSAIALTMPRDGLAMLSLLRSARYLAVQAKFGLPICPCFLVGRALFPYPCFHVVVVQYNERFDYDGMERFIGGREVV